MRILLLLILLSITNLVQSQSSKSLKYEIYSFVFNDFFKNIMSEKENESIVVKKYSSYSYLEGIKSDSIPDELIKNLCHSSKIKKLNLKRIQSPRQIKGISRIEDYLIFRKGPAKGWKKFYQKNPNAFGLIEISDIVFSKDNKYCLLYFSYRINGKNGRGFLFYIDLNNEKKILNEEVVWIS